MLLPVTARRQLPARPAWDGRPVNLPFTVNPWFTVNQEFTMPGRHSKDLVPLRKRPKRPTTDASYAGMLRRMHFGYAKRIGADPDALEHLRSIEDAARDAVNLGIFFAHCRSDGQAASLSAIGDALGVSKQAIAKRVNLGREVADRLEAQGKLTSRPVNPELTRP